MAIAITGIPHSPRPPRRRRPLPLTAHLFTHVHLGSTPARITASPKPRPPINHYRSMCGHRSTEFMGEG